MMHVPTDFVAACKAELKGLVARGHGSSLKARELRADIKRGSAAPKWDPEEPWDTDGDTSKWNENGEAQEAAYDRATSYEPEF